MRPHELWHVLVLATTLVAAAAGAIAVLAPLVFDRPPPGLARLRPAIAALVGSGVLLLVVEWLSVH